MGARRRNLQLARGSAESVCLCAHRSLHYVLPRPHHRPCTHTTPLHATTLHSHLLPAHISAPHSHLCFGYKQPVPGALLGLVSAAAEDRATLLIHSTHSINTRTHPTPTRLGNVYKRALVVPPPPLTKERSSVGRALAPYRLASRCCPFSIPSSNGLGCIV